MWRLYRREPPHGPAHTHREPGPQVGGCSGTAHAEDQNWSPGPLAHGPLIKRKRLGARVSVHHPPSA